MAEVFRGPDALHVYLTGAVEEGIGQYDHALSLGGARSGARVSTMTVQRVTAFPGLRLRHVGAANGIGTGRLFAGGANKLKWAAPGEGYGALVEILDGQTRVLYSATPSKYIVVERTSVLPLSGVENIQIADTANNVIGMSNFTTAQSTAGSAKRRGLILKNLGELSITNLKAWVDEALDTRLRIASESVVDGAIQTIANETTAPTGLSWSTPTEASPLTIGTVSAGALTGLWVERYVSAGATASGAVRAGVRFRFDYDGQTYEQSLRGVGRIAEAGIAGYLYWWGHGAEPDWQNGPHDEYAAALPVELTEVLTAGKHWLVCRRRNQYGIVGPPEQPIKTIEIDDALEASPERPSGPSLVQVRPWGAGGHRIDAQYMPSFDRAGYRATHWIVYTRIDGTDPDPETDTPVEVAMMYNSLTPGVGTVLLEHIVAGTELEDTPVRVLVRTRRAEQEWLGNPVPTADSDNTDVYATAVEYCGPTRPSGIARYRDGLGIYTPPEAGPNETVDIDVANNIYWELLPGQTRLWAGGALVWNIRYDSGSSHNGIFTPLMHDAIDVNEAGSVDAIDVLSWTGGDKRLGINVNGTRRMLIDVTNGWIRNAYVGVEEEPSGSCQSVPIWPKYADTCFMVWDPNLQGFVSVASLDTQGRLYSRVGLFTGVPESECL